MSIELVQAFKEIIHTMRANYAGNRYKRSYDKPQSYINRYTAELMEERGYDRQFAEQAGLYVARFKDPSVYLQVNHAKSYYHNYTRGFSVRRYQDRLWVCKAEPECGVAVGEQIIAIDGPTIEHLSTNNVYGPTLYGTTPEREEWGHILHFARTCTVEAPDGSQRSVTLSQLPLCGGREGFSILPCYRTPGLSPAIEISELDNGIELITLRDLSDAAVIDAFAEEKHERLNKARGLIFDVRACSGGDISSILPLMPYLFDTAHSPSEFMEDIRLTNYSEENCERQIKALDRLLNNPKGVNEDTVAMINELKADLTSKCGTGIIEEDGCIPEAFKAPLEPAGEAQQVCVLTDLTCEGAAETLALICQISERAHTVGRATRGGDGFFNPIQVRFDSGFSLVYSMSCYTEEGLARHFNEVGIPPEVEVNWTPEFLEHDPDLDAAQNLIGTM